MAWIELHQTLPKNKKTLKFKRLLKIKTPQAVGHLSMLWLWALDNAEDGDLSEFTADDIAEVCEWAKEPDVFVKALVSAGFVTDDMHIHDWGEYTGRLVTKREIQREQSRVRQQRYRDRLKNSRDDGGDVTDENEDVTHNASVNNAPIPYPTVPNRTLPDISGGGGDAHARVNDLEDDDEDNEVRSVSQVVEDASGKRKTMEEIQALPEAVYSRFIETVAILYSEYFDGKKPCDYDYSAVYRMLRLLRRSGGQWHPVTMDDDQIELLTACFQAAADSGKMSIAYLFGVVKRCYSRGITTTEQFWQYQANRDMKKPCGQGGRP